MSKFSNKIDFTAYISILTKNFFGSWAKQSYIPLLKLLLYAMNALWAIKIWMSKFSKWIDFKVYISILTDNLLGSWAKQS